MNQLSSCCITSHGRDHTEWVSVGCGGQQASGTKDGTSSGCMLDNLPSMRTYSHHQGSETKHVSLSNSKQDNHPNMRTYNYQQASGNKDGSSSGCKLDNLPSMRTYYRVHVPWLTSYYYSRYNNGKVTSKLVWTATGVIKAVFKSFWRHWIVLQNIAS